MLCQGIEERLSELYVLQILCSAAQPHTVRPFKIMQKPKGGNILLPKTLNENIETIYWPQNEGSSK